VPFHVTNVPFRVTKVPLRAQVRHRGHIWHTLQKFPKCCKCSLQVTYVPFSVANVPIQITLSLSLSVLSIPNRHIYSWCTHDCVKLVCGSVVIYVNVRLVCFCSSMNLPTMRSQSSWNSAATSIKPSYRTPAVQGRPLNQLLLLRRVEMKKKRLVLPSNFGNSNDILTNFDKGITEINAESDFLNFVPHLLFQKKLFVKKFPTGHKNV